MAAEPSAETSGAAAPLWARKRIVIPSSPRAHGARGRRRGISKTANGKAGKEILRLHRPAGGSAFGLAGRLCAPHAKASALCKSKAHLPEAKRSFLPLLASKNCALLQDDGKRAKPQAGRRSARANSRGQGPRRLGSSSLHHEKTRHKCTVFFRGGVAGKEFEHFSSPLLPRLFRQAARARWLCQRQNSDRLQFHCHRHRP